MKKIFVIIILIIVILGVIFFLVDFSKVKKHENPIFTISFESQTYMDGGTKIYWGIGYKIIAYNKLNGYNKMHIGSYFMQYDDSL